MNRDGTNEGESGDERPRDAPATSEERRENDSAKNASIDEKFFEALSLLTGERDKGEKMIALCRMLEGGVEKYDWVGLYWLSPTGEDELVLGVYSGAPTEHISIPCGRGICGQVAESKKTMIVRDVALENNYLSCSSKVKSEIVVPVFKDGCFIGVLDIDSHSPAAFGTKDEKLLRRICGEVGRIL